MLNRRPEYGAVSRIRMSYIGWRLGGRVRRLLREKLESRAKGSGFFFPLVIPHGMAVTQY
jgi:hypothetical protein